MPERPDEPLIDSLVGVKVDGDWQWFDIDHLANAEAAINTLHMMHALELDDV